MHVTKRFHAEELDMNMTPMIDVVFQLLIFFLVVSELASQDRVEELTLPTARAAIVERVLPSRLIISVDRHNRIWIAGRVRNIQEVERYLKIERQGRGKGKKRTEQPVLISADRNSRWEIVQDIIEKANAYQFYKMSFSVKKKEA